MAFTVRTERVTAVRIGDEWSGVEEGTFDVDSFSFSVGEDGNEIGDRQMGVRATLSGGGGLLAAPLSALTGVRYSAD